MSFLGKERDWSLNGFVAPIFIAAFLAVVSLSFFSALWCSQLRILKNGVIFWVRSSLGESKEVDSESSDLSDLLTNSVKYCSMKFRFMRDRHSLPRKRWCLTKSRGGSNSTIQ